MLSPASFPTLRQCVAKIGWTHISLTLVGMMWVLPFLYFYHQFPLTTFYQECGAALLGLGAMSLLASKRYWQQPHIPRIVLLPLGLALVVLVQFALGRGVYLNYTLLVMLYLLWVALLMMLGQYLREELGLPLLATALAAFLLLGAELSAMVGILQNYPWRSILDYVVSVKTGAAVVGNMGQPNHFADYTTLGLISLGLLRLRWNMRAWQTALLAAPLLFVLVLSGSRSAWLYLLFLAALAYLWQRRDKSCLPFLHYSLLLLLGFGLMHLVVQIPWLAGLNGNETSMDRMIAAGTASFGAGGSSSIRLHIWHEAWLIFSQFQLLGAGFGQFGWQHFLLGPSLHNTNIQGLYNNAHDLVMQTAAEMGLAGLLVLLGTLALWLRQARSAAHTVYHWWGYGLLAVLAIHSLLEYPLWYVYFLGVAALVLGMLDNTAYRLGSRVVGRWSLTGVLLLGAFTMWQAAQGYGKLEMLNAHIRPESQRDGSDAEQRMEAQPISDGLMAIQGIQSLLLRPYIEFAQSRAGWDHVTDKGALNERVMRFAPVGVEVYRESLLLARAGRQDAAAAQMERAIWAFPGDFPATLEKLRALAQMDADPARFPALLEFALQKYQEHQHASHSE